MSQTKILFDENQNEDNLYTIQENDSSFSSELMVKNDLIIKISNQIVFLELKILLLIL